MKKGNKKPMICLMLDLLMRRSITDPTDILKNSLNHQKKCVDSRKSATDRIVRLSNAKKRRDRRLRMTPTKL